MPMTWRALLFSGLWQQAKSNKMGWPNGSAATSRKRNEVN
jgi:hypothetical protein